MSAIRKLELSAVTIVCAPLGEIIAQRRAISGQSVAEPVSIDELECLRLPSTASTEATKWRDRLVSNLRKAAGASQTGGQAALGSTLNAVVAAVHGMREAQAVSESAVVPHIDYSQAPTVACEVSFEHIDRLLPYGDELMVTHYQSESGHFIDVAAQIATDLKTPEVLTVLRDRTLVTRTKQKHVELRANGKDTRSIALPEGAAAAKALHSGGFIVRLFDDTIRRYDHEGTFKAEWNASVAGSDWIVPLSDDSVAMMNKACTGIDIANTMTGDVLRSWDSGDPNVVITDFLVLSDDRLFVTTVDKESKETATRVIDTDGAVSFGEPLSYFMACALKDGFIATIEDQDLFIRNAFGKIVNKVAIDEVSYASLQEPLLAALPDGRLVVGNRFTNKVVVYRFPEATVVS